LGQGMADGAGTGDDDRGGQEAVSARGLLVIGFSASRAGSLDSRSTTRLRYARPNGWRVSLLAPSLFEHAMRYRFCGEGIFRRRRTVVKGAATHGGGDVD
jgi:hypothetical protein